MLDDSVVGFCIEEAARHKKSRKDVSRALLEPESAKIKILDILNNPNHTPNKPKHKTIIDGSNNKKRDIDIFQFVPDQVMHHVLMYPFKDIVERGLYEQVYCNLPGYGVHLAQKTLVKWASRGKKKYVIEADIHHAYQSVDLNILASLLEEKIRDKEYLDMLYKYIFYEPNKKDQVGLSLGNYMSPWLFHFYLKKFDHYAAKFKNIRYLRYADNIFLIGPKKRSLKKAFNMLCEYLNDILHLKLNNSTQLYRFEYLKKDGSVRGRAINALGIVIHWNRVTVRKSILKRFYHKALAISKKNHVSWYDACSFMSRMQLVYDWDIFQFYIKYIKGHINLKDLKYKIRTHSKKLSFSRKNKED